MSGPPGSGRFADFVRRYFGTKNGESITVLPDVMPVVMINEEAPELRAYRAERRFTVTANQAAGGAGNYSTLTFGLAPTANRMVVVERALVYKGAANHVFAYMVSALASYAGGALQGTVLDSRAATNPASPVTLTDVQYAGTTPAVGPTFVQFIDAWMTGAGVVAWSPFFPPVVLDPGGPALQFKDAVANEAMDIVLLCYDVPLHGAEEW